MTPEAAVLMASYNRWMNQRLYQAAATLTEEEIARDRGAFFGSILRTLNHIAIADTIWLNRFSQSEDAVFLHGALAAFPAPRALDQPLAVSLRGLERHRAALDQVICDWSHTLTAPQLDASLTYRNTAGKAFMRSMGALTMHFFNHQTHHRGQVTTLLSQAGVDVGETDLLALIPEER